MSHHVAPSRTKWGCLRKGSKCGAVERVRWLPALLTVPVSHVTAVFCHLVPLFCCSYVMNSHLVVNPWAIFEFSTTMDLVRPSVFPFRLFCLRVMLLESSWAPFH